jgi:hypothetical protein
MAQAREKFATEVDFEILSALRGIAEKEGRRIDAVVDEAFADLIEKRKKATLRARFMAAYLASHERFASLYKKLAE